MSLQQFTYDAVDVDPHTKVVFIHVPVTPVCYCSGLPPEPQLHNINQPKTKTAYDELVDSFVQSNIKALEQTSKKRPVENNTKPKKRPRMDKSPEKKQCYINSTVGEKPSLKLATDSKSKNSISWASNYLQTIGQIPKAIKLNLKTKNFQNSFNESKRDRSEKKTNENIQSDTMKNTMTKESFNTIEKFAPVRPKLKFVIPKLNKPKADDTDKAKSVDVIKQTNIDTLDTKISKIKVGDKIVHKKEHVSVEPKKHQKLNIRCKEPVLKTHIGEKHHERAMNKNKVNLTKNNDEVNHTIDNRKYKLDEKTIKKNLQLKELNSILKARKFKTSSFMETSKRKHSDMKHTSMADVHKKIRTKISELSIAPIKSRISIKDEKIIKKKHLPPILDRNCKSKNSNSEFYKENKKTKRTVSPCPSTNITDAFTDDKLSSNIVPSCTSHNIKYSCEKRNANRNFQRENKNKKIKSIVTSCHSLSGSLIENKCSDQIDYIDLRVKLNKMEQNRKLKGSEQEFKNKIRENLIINVNNENTNSSPMKITEDSKKTKEPSFKEIKVEINIIRAQNQQQPMKEKTFEESDINDELSFLDDFDIDDVVNCLKECENKRGLFKTDETNEDPYTKDSDANIEEKLAMLFVESEVKKPEADLSTTSKDKSGTNQNEIKKEDDVIGRETIMNEPFSVDTTIYESNHKCNKLLSEDSNCTEKLDNKPLIQLNKNTIMSAGTDVDMKPLVSDIEAKNVTTLGNLENSQITTLSNYCSLQSKAVEPLKQEEPYLTIIKDNASEKTNIQTKQNCNSVKSSNVDVLSTIGSAEADKQTVCIKSEVLELANSEMVISTDIQHFSEDSGINNNGISNSPDISSTNSLQKDEKNANLKMSIIDIDEGRKNLCDETELPVGSETIELHNTEKKGGTKRKVSVESLPCNSYVQNDTMKGFTSDIKCDTILAKSVEKMMSKYSKEKFTMLSVIHRGQFSTIFCCKDSADKLFAAKVFTYERDRTNSYQCAKMIKEYQKDIPKQNLNCIFLIRNFTILKKMVFLLEYCPYNLAQYLKKDKKSLHVDDLQKLARQLIGAVTTLRNNNIVHSDIKPSHILINSSGDQLKLCGFDAAYYVLPAILQPNIGSINYRAPEIILGYSASFSIDVWSTAVVLYEMATGHQLFPGTFNNNMLYQQMATLGNMPLELLNGSCAMSHFKGTSFIRRYGFLGKKKMLIPYFTKSARLATSIFEAYAKDWSQSVPKAQRDVDSAKLRSLYRLLERMLALHPEYRLPIEFAYASPFIYYNHAD